MNKRPAEPHVPEPLLEPAPEKPEAVDPFPPGSPSYVMREFDREPDERIAALHAQWTELNQQLFDCAMKHGPDIEKVRARLKQCEEELKPLIGASDRVRRLLRLRGNIDFSEWLALKRRSAPIILRYGVPVPSAEQDGYTERDYDDWRNAGSPKQHGNPGKENLEVWEEDGVWNASLSIQVSAIGRSRELAEQNARLRAGALAKSGNAQPHSNTPPHPNPVL